MAQTFLNQRKNQEWDGTDFLKSAKKPGAGWHRLLPLNQQKDSYHLVDKTGARARQMPFWVKVPDKERL